MCRPNKEYEDNKGVGNRDNRDSYNNNTTDDNSDDDDLELLNSYVQRLRDLHQEIERVQEDIRRVREECRVLREQVKDVRCEKYRPRLSPPRLQFQTAEMLLLGGVTIVVLTWYLWIMSLIMTSLERFFTW